MVATVHSTHGKSHFHLHSLWASTRLLTLPSHAVGRWSVSGTLTLDLSLSHARCSSSRILKKILTRISSSGAFGWVGGDLMTWFNNIMLREFKLSWVVDQRLDFILCRIRLWCGGGSIDGFCVALVGDGQFEARMWLVPSDRSASSWARSLSELYVAESAQEWSSRLGSGLVSKVSLNWVS